MADKIDMRGRGARGESFGDVARRIGAIGDLDIGPTDTDTEILDGLGGMATAEADAANDQAQIAQRAQSGQGDFTGDIGLELVDEEGNSAQLLGMPMPAFTPPTWPPVDEHAYDFFTPPMDTSIFSFILPVIGQSNAIGVNADGADAIVASAAIYPDYVRTFAGGPRWTAPVGGHVELVEDDDGDTRETMASSRANHLTRNMYAKTGQYIHTFSFVVGQGSRPYMALRRGNQAVNNYAAALANAVAIIRARGMVPIVPSIAWVGGESDMDQLLNMSPERYARQMQQADRHLAAITMRITGQAETPVLLLTQHGLSLTVAPMAPKSRQGIVDADGRGNIRTVGPAYPLSHSTAADDKLHWTCRGQNVMGHAVARADMAEIFGAGYRPIRVDRSRVHWTSSTTLVIPYEGQRIPLTLDTSGTVVDMTGLANKGYEFLTWAGVTKAVTSIDIVDFDEPLSGNSYSADSAVLVTFTAPVTEPLVMQYALKPASGADKPGRLLGGRGCLRSTYANVSLYGGGTEYDWALAEQVPVGCF